MAPLAFAYNTAVHSTTKVSPFEMVYGRKPRLPIDLIFPTEVEFKVELEPEDFVLEKQEAMKRVFEFVALAREGSIQRQKFLHDRQIRGNKFKLLDRVYLKNEKPRVGVSKKLKFRYEGIYTIVEILESRSEDEVTNLYKIKPEGRGRPQVVNGSKLKKAIGPVSIAKAKKFRSNISQHMEEAIHQAIHPEMHSQEIREECRRRRMNDPNTAKRES